MNTTKAAHVTQAFKILSDPTRLKILTLLFEKRSLCVGDVAEAVGISHSAASHQLTALAEKGILSACRDGKTMCYCLHDTQFVRKLSLAIKLFA